jgi:Lrp/AsnC family transcriptional regulator for asnA, asnC and gidA
MQTKPRIDQTDAKILKTLLREARTSFTKIAEDCGISIGAVRMRYKRLWKDGIINGEIMLVNPHSLGFEHVIDLGITTTPEKEKEVTEFLESKYKHVSVAGHFGKYNVFGVAAFHNTQELTDAIQDLESNPNVKRIETMIWADSVYMEHMEKLVFGPLGTTETPNKTLPSATTREEARMDQVDRQIARKLSQNARTPFRRIAQELGISTKNVIHRYKKLRGPVLTLSTITVDLRKLGYQAFAFFYAKVSRSKMPEIYSEMIKMPNLVVIIKHIGTYDMHGTVFLHSFEDLFEATESIRRIPGMEHVEIYVTPVWERWPPNLFVSLL